MKLASTPAERVTQEFSRLVGSAFEAAAAVMLGVGACSGWCAPVPARCARRGPGGSELPDRARVGRGADRVGGNRGRHHRGDRARKIQPTGSLSSSPGWSRPRSRRSLRSWCAEPHRADDGTDRRGGAGSQRPKHSLRAGDRCGGEGAGGGARSCAGRGRASGRPACRRRWRPDRDRATHSRTRRCGIVARKSRPSQRAHGGNASPGSYSEGCAGGGVAASHSHPVDGVARTVEFVMQIVPVEIA